MRVMWACAIWNAYWKLEIKREMGKRNSLMSTIIAVVALSVVWASE